MSTAFDRKTDGQTSRINQAIETYLRNYFDYEQNDHWAEMVAMAEFAYNNCKHSPRKMARF
jgi:hypothetical protein